MHLKAKECRKVKLMGVIFLTTAWPKHGCVDISELAASWSFIFWELVGYVRALCSREDIA